MEKYQEKGVTKYRGVKDDTPMDDLMFQPSRRAGGDTLHTLITNAGTLTVLERLETGHYPYNWDIESGFRDASGLFWLASGGVDVRTGCNTFGDAVAMIKKLANVCAGKKPRKGD